MKLVSSKVNIETLRSLAVGTAPSPHTLADSTKALVQLAGVSGFLILQHDIVIYKSVWSRS